MHCIMQGSSPMHTNHICLLWRAETPWCVMAQVP